MTEGIIITLIICGTIFLVAILILTRIIVEEWLTSRRNSDNETAALNRFEKLLCNYSTNCHKKCKYDFHCIKVEKCDVIEKFKESLDRKSNSRKFEEEFIWFLSLIESLDDNSEFEITSKSLKKYGLELSRAEAGKLSVKFKNYYKMISNIEYIKGSKYKKISK